MSKEQIKTRLIELGLTPSKQRGQNFLCDDSVIDEIVRFGDPRPEDTLVEIGPGLGALTRELQGKSKKFAAIEIDSLLAAEVRKYFPEVEVLEQDVREVSFSQFGENLLVFGNLPYSASTDILFHIIEQATCIQRAVFLLQKEFVERISAAHGGRDYGVLSITCQTRCKVRAGEVVPGECFYPVANVNSQVVELDFRNIPDHGIRDFSGFRKMLEAAFFRRRKKLSNSIQSSPYPNSENLLQAFINERIDPELRPEQISVEQYTRVWKRFKG